MKTGGVILVTGRTDQPLLTITRHVSLSQASETQAVSFNKLQFVFACLCLELNAGIQQMVGLFAEKCLEY